MEVPISVLADYANATNDGKLNVMGIFDTIYAEAFPAVHLELRIVVKFRFSAGERGSTKTTRIILLDPDGNEISSGGGAINIPKDAPLTPEVNNIGVFRGVVFPKPGDYSFSVLVNDDEKARIPLHVLQKQPAQGE